MRRTALCLLLLAAVGRAAGDTRLGTLICWYLAERVPSRQVEILEKIRTLADDDVDVVAGAIRRGEHFRHEASPAFEDDGPPPVFRLDRTRIQPMAGAEGRYATLELPAGYDPAHAHALVVDLGPTTVPVPGGAARVRVDVGAHPQAAESALAAEALVLSLVARTFDLVHVDARRVFLRAQGEVYVPLAWYIALHNPDRFAGLLGAQAGWRDAENLVENSLQFSILAIESRRGDPELQRFFALDKRIADHHLLLRAPGDPALDGSLLPVIEAWHERTMRAPGPSALTVHVDREEATRLFWVRVPAKPRSQRSRGSLGGVWAYRSLSIPAVLRARIAAEDRNLVRIDTFRVATFDILVDPRLFDVARPLRVSINGEVPEARLIDPRISDLLEDYRERRDPELLYACRLTFTVRRDPSRPPTGS